jgi:hypothetical protein
MEEQHQRVFQQVMQHFEQASQAFQQSQLDDNNNNGLQQYDSSTLPYEVQFFGVPCDEVISVHINATPVFSYTVANVCTHR